MSRYESVQCALSGTGKVETKLRAELQEFHDSKVLGEEISRVVIAFDVEQVDDSLLIYFADVVVSDIDVLRPRLRNWIRCNEDRSLVVSCDRYMVDVVAKFSK